MTTFIVNGKARKLEMRDDNNIDWSADFIGNTSHGMERDGEGNYIATQEEYDWWKNMIVAYQGMEETIKQYKAKYGADEVDEWLQKSSAFDVDLEDQPGSVKNELLAMDEANAE